MENFSGERPCGSCVKASKADSCRDRVAKVRERRIRIRRPNVAPAPVAAPTNAAKSAPADPAAEKASSNSDEVSLLPVKSIAIATRAVYAARKPKEVRQSSLVSLDSDPVRQTGIFSQFYSPELYPWCESSEPALIALTLCVFGVSRTGCYRCPSRRRGPTFARC